MNACRTAADRRPPIRIGISACLLGDEVRFDGGHKRDRFLTDTLGPFVEWVKVCPEVEMGLGTPRETLRLVAADGDAAPDHDQDGDRSHRCDERAGRPSACGELADEQLSGYVLKKDSPSCGMARVKVYGLPMPERSGRGLFATTLMARFPNLPVEEEGRLSDPRLRENFIERVFAYRRLRDVVRRPLDDREPDPLPHRAQDVAAVALDHRVPGARPSGRRRARAEAVGADASAYESLFMSTMAKIATPARHTNVLQHMAGHLKRLIDARLEARAAGCDRRVPPRPRPAGRATDAAAALRARCTRWPISPARPISKRIRAS